MAKRRPSGDGMVRKREDGRWEGRIVVGHKENGEPIFHYISAKTQKALLEKLHRSMEEYDGAELTEQSYQIVINYGLNRAEAYSLFCDAILECVRLQKGIFSGA